MDQPVGRITQFRLHPIRPLWTVGPGWAAVGGALASGGLALTPQTLLTLALVWLLADPVLGVVWDLGVGDTSLVGKGGIWRRLFSPHLPDVAPPLRFLPYTQPNSPGRRLAARLSRLRLWWHATFWPEAGAEFAALVAALGLALLLGVILGRSALALVLFYIVLSWLAVLSEKGYTPFHSSLQQPKSIVTLWRALADFGIPWLLGALVLGKPGWVVLALGICYSITYFGLIRQATQPTSDFRLIGASQATAAWLLIGLRHPLAAGATAILLLPQWGLRNWADHPAACGPYLRGIQPFVILAMLGAAVAAAM